MIGIRLREERERLGYTQEDFSLLGEASKRTQIEWEKGAAFPNAFVLERFASVGADVQYIITGIRQPDPKAVSLAAESAFKMVESGGITVTPQQFANMVMALLPTLSTASKEAEAKEKPAKEKNVAKKISGKAQVAQGNGIVQVGGAARISSAKKLKSK
ncbi:helix-turn-helix domain-containing protein [Collimonas antrihumi]|uniref:helix-turn-helix domain-containing protein n=1 Tax=Collimonas antrihumi TaxID=1940615 RepID=UPI001B8B28B9|nr:helix-turn-helix transcriptional regulator [Collimonas antrihumi]